MKKISLFLILILLLVGIYGCTTNEGEHFENAYITLDINPSIEIITNDEGVVSDIHALNDDAEVLLINTDLTGKVVSEVVEEILVLANDMGYLEIEAENAILITTVSDNDEKTKLLDNKISEKVREFVRKREMKLEVIKGNLSATLELQELADSLNISIGKLKLVTYVSEFNDIPIEEAAEMSIRDLNKLIKETRKEVKDFYHEEIREKYLDAKAEFKEMFHLKKIELLNDAIQNTDDAKLAEIIGNDNAQEVKDLYAEYYNALIMEKEKEVDEHLSQKYAEFKTKQEQLKERLKNLYSEFLNLRNKSRKEIRDQISETRSQLEDIDNEMHSFSRGHKKFKFVFRNENNQLSVVKYKNMLSMYRDIRKDYQKKFLELDVELEQLEQYYIDELTNKINEIHNEITNSLEQLQEQFKEEGKFIKEYMQSENEVRRKSN